MPEDVEQCVESVLSDNPEYDESKAYAICNAELRGEVTLRGLPDEAVQQLRRRHDPDVVQLAGDEVTLEGVDGETVGRILDRYNVEPIGGLATGDSGVAAHQRSAAIGVDVPTGPAGVIARQADEDEFDPDDPPEEYREAIEADDFVIYGKASVEKVDLMGTRFSVDALERALGRFFKSEDAPGIISRGHADVPVGRPVREHTLESDTVINLDGETYEFSAGETIRTEAKDADGDDIPELWLVSRLANDSDIARETRYKALTGELDGYSVTIKPKDGATRETETSEDILALDLHAVTVGTDEQILNPDSKFDVAEFRALFGDGDHPTLAHSDDVEAVAEALGRRLATLLSR